MIVDARMKLLKEDGEFKYYVFKPTFSRLYFHGSENDASHRKSFLHRLHMRLYFIMGGYKVLYLEKDDQIVGYLVYKRAGKSIVQNTTNKDAFTVFIYTFPQYRNLGMASRLANCYIQFCCSSCKYIYKTIAKTNLSSIKVAEKLGFKRIGNAVKTRFLHTVKYNVQGDWYLYEYHK